MHRSPKLEPLPLPDGAQGITIFEASLSGDEERPPVFWNFLNDEERARADRFRFAPDRRRYVMVRGLLRELLGERLGIAPAAVRFHVGPHGKPALFAGRVLGFNVSHSGERALLALADDERELGVDLESAARLGGARDLPGLAARTLTPGDLARWQALPEGERTWAFLRAWTRIEAYGKATGQGLGTLLGTVGVTFGTGPAARLSDGAAAAGWSLFDLPVGEGWAGALVVGSPT